MTLDEIKQYVKATMTADEAYDLLARVFHGGDSVLPDLPDSLALIKRKRGRPSQKTTAMWRAAIVSKVAFLYPRKVSIVELAQYARVPVEVIRKSIKDEKFMSNLSPQYRTYLKSIVVVKKRLSPFWRAVLDVHNYIELIKHPYHKLPLYKQHLPMYAGQSIPIDRAGMSSKTYNEVQRIFGTRFSLLLERTNREMPVAWTDRKECEDKDILDLCGGGPSCSVVEAFVKGDIHGYDISRLQELTGVPVTWHRGFILSNPNDYESVVIELLGGKV